MNIDDKLPSGFAPPTGLPASRPRAPRIVVLTHFPSPYQVELFDAIDALEPGALAVYYLHRADRDRSWQLRPPRHRAHFLGDGVAVHGAACRDLRAARFAVFNFYNEPLASMLLKTRAASGLPWCFWGERPGYRHPWLGRLARLWKLRALHRSASPVWGIGHRAVDAYAQEFGRRRAYVNLPYFSDLARFSAGERAPVAGQTIFLYSGALSHRKGVDVLARAFCRLARVEPDARLAIMGAGDLRSAMEKTLSSCAARVEWVGFRDWEALPAVYCSAHFLCVPSRRDGWGLVVPEGLAAGLPVIATDQTGAALELVSDGDNGWLLPAGDEDALFAAMQAAARLAPSERQRMSVNAVRSVAGHTLAHGARRFLAAVESALREASTPLDRAASLRCKPGD